MHPLEEWHLPTVHLGRRVLRYERLDSTNTLAAELAQGPANDGLVILADEQTAGRGQHGRRWLCEPGAGVLLSVLLFPPPELRRPVLMAAWAAVSVCETIRRATGLTAKIKWPNDVLVKGRKVCGILIEQARGTVVGIGLNVNQSAESLAALNLPQAGSLAVVVGGTLDRLQVARLLIERLDEEYDRLRGGDLATLEACWKWHTGLLGRHVLVECHDTTYRGRLREQGWEGLELEVAGADPVRLAPESVLHLHPA
jgi:BirA family transcriptional regulator, biotin operon repressor / biotin---[acetyl-CoA-carboxylase] ligase